MLYTYRQKLIADLVQARWHREGDALREEIMRLASGKKIERDVQRRIYGVLAAADDTLVDALTRTIAFLEIEQATAAQDIGGGCGVWAEHVREQPARRRPMTGATITI